jgi:vacuolar-type H+-ATPase subunit F/Vma7
VGEQEDVPGVMLGGLGNIQVIRNENANEVFEKLKKFSGLILLTKKAEELLGDRKNILESPERIIHTMPGKDGDEYETIDKIVKQTIGFDLKTKRHGKNS